MNQRSIISSSLGQISIIIISIIIYFGFVPDIKQDQAYHNFADQRSYYGVSNYSNVITNVVFFVVGMWGIIELYLITNRSYFLNDRYELFKNFIMQLIFFLSVAFTCTGSAYYHIMPNNSTLVWDRLPMSVAFMSLLCIILENHKTIPNNIFTKLLFISVGVASVFWWSIYDDLKPYILVQFGSILCVLVLLWNKRAMLMNRSKLIKIFCGFGIFGGTDVDHRVRTFDNFENKYYYLAIGIFWYIVAKFLEFFDVAVFEYTNNTISGHALKHITSGIGAYFCGLYVLTPHTDFRILKTNSFFQSV